MITFAVATFNCIVCGGTLAEIAYSGRFVELAISSLSKRIQC